MVKLGIALDAFLDKVLDGFDIMINAAFDVFDSGSVFFRKPLGQIFEEVAGVSTQGRTFWQTRMRSQHDEPANFDLDTESNQAKFTEQGAEGFEFLVVTSVQRREGHECRVGVHVGSF